MSIPVIAHLMDEYSPLSQTFIYQYLSKMSATHPVVIAQHLVNLDLFPLKDVFLVKQPHVIRWFRNRLIFRFAADPYPLTEKYAGMLRNCGAEVLHAHFGHVGYQALALKRRLNLPLVVTFYGFDMSSLPTRRSWRKAYRLLFQEADKFLVEGSTMAEKLGKLGCPSGKIIIQHIAVDLSNIEFEPRQWDGRSPVNIFMAGRFVEKKGFIYAIRAFAKISSKWSSAQLRIAGDGPLRKNLEAEISKLGITKRVHLLGAQSYSNYLTEARQAHIFMSPSITARNGDTEGGAPTTLIEMQASGLPVLSTYHADIPHIVRDGVTGFLVKEKDTMALADKLDWFLSNSEAWQEMGVAGRKYMLEEHNIEVEVRKLEQVYTELMC
ncbi:MAG: glycosyltransferase [Anaerolineales bacterium]|nr:glycosyltransferase [Anaerolineales bacterium]